MTASARDRTRFFPRRLTFWLLILLLIVLVSLLCSLSNLSSLVIQSLHFEQSLRVYPDAREVSRATTIVTTNTSTWFEARYYWTKASEITVKAYYQVFTATPFSENRALFYPTGETPTSASRARNHCYDESNYHISTCIEIQVIGFEGQAVVLPNVSGDDGHAIAHPDVQPTPSLEGGTLVIYCYYLGELDIF